MILASIFIGPPGRGDDIELPPIVAENIASLKRHHPDLPHRLFSGEDVLAFLERHFPREVTDAYNTLKPYSYKADLARFCILYQLGGVYADLAYFLVRPMPIDGKRLVVFRDLMLSAPWDTCTSVIGAPARHPAFQRAIELVCANVERRYYGPTYLCPTGPTLFGQALAMACAAEELIAGAVEVVPVERFPDKLRRFDLPNLVRCVGLNRNLIALSRKRGGLRGLADLGVEGSDNYQTRWENRDVYENPESTE